MVNLMSNDVNNVMQVTATSAYVYMPYEIVCKPSTGR